MKNTGEIISEIQGDIKEELQPFINLISEIEGMRDPDTLKELIELSRESIQDLSNYDCSHLLNNDELVRSEVSKIMYSHIEENEAELIFLHEKYSREKSLGKK